MTMNHFEQLSKNQATSANGSYRKIVATPQELTYDIVAMQSGEEDLLTPNYLTQPDPTPVLTDPAKATKALRMKFTLATSSYATMLLREVTRMSSAFATQCALSKAN